MENNEKSQVKSLTDYLPFGYLYLLVLGIASDSIYYGILGINIMSYSSILDVLISPIARLTSNIVFPILVIGLPLLNYFYLKFALARMAKKNSDKKPSKLASLPFSTLWLFFTGMVIFSAYIGNGIGAGLVINKKLKDNNLSPDYTLTFQNNDILNVRMIGNNSGYIFYISEGKNVVAVSPIPFTIKKIEEKE